MREGWTGLLPAPGAKGRYESQGFRNSNDLPFEFNPARRYIATANNDIVPQGYNIPLGYDGWAPPFRVERIREMLSSGKKFDIEDFERMQGESGDPSSRHYGDLLQDWAAGRYHPLPFSRKAVEAATEERIVLQP